jgi:hypothetical protein
MIEKGLELITCGSLVPILFSSGGWIRTSDLRVMSFNPISFTLARRAIDLGVAWRYSILKSLV